MRFAICNLIFIGLLVGGCDDKTAAPPASRVVTIPAAGAATVHGRVRVDAKVAPPVQLNNSICRHAEPIYDESVIADADGYLKNAIVYIDEVAGPTDAPVPPVVELDQKNCQFVPHVLALRTGQTLRIKNSDDEVHDVHAMSSVNPAANVSLPVKGSSKDVSFSRPEMIPVRCDVHPWMNGTIGVFASSYFAVTDDQGAYTITGLPPGTYEVVVWHERYGQMRQTVNVTSANAETNFLYEPPK